MQHSKTNEQVSFTLYCDLPIPASNSISIEFVRKVLLITLGQVLITLGLATLLVRVDPIFQWLQRRQVASSNGRGVYTTSKMTHTHMLVLQPLYLVDAITTDVSSGNFDCMATMDALLSIIIHISYRYARCFLSHASIHSI